LPSSRPLQVTDCLRRGCAPPPPAFAFGQRATDGGGGTSDSRKRKGHGAGKVNQRVDFGAFNLVLLLVFLLWSYDTLVLTAVLV
jgi:hypothetical protein